MKKVLVISFAFIVLFLCSCHKSKTVVNTDRPEVVHQSAITEEMAYEGVSNYCHSTYDWSIAKDNPSIMYVEMGEDTESEYQVVFRSYTGAFVHFYVDKTSGNTRMVEKVPTLDVEEDAGTINLFDYLEKGN